VLALLTMAVAWIVYRPVLGIAILVAAGALGFLLKSRLGRPKAAPALAEEPTLRRAA
jgi:hypothetical protein